MFKKYFLVLGVVASFSLAEATWAWEEALNYVIVNNTDYTISLLKKRYAKVQGKEWGADREESGCRHCGIPC